MERIKYTGLRVVRRVRSVRFRHLYVVFILILAFGIIFELNNLNTDKHQESLVQNLSSINNSVASLPTLVPATPTQVTNAEEFSYDVFQTSQAIGENQPDSLPIYMRFVPFMGNYGVQRDIDYTNNILVESKQSLIQTSQDTEYLLKFLFYSPTAEFATYGQNETLDDERVQRTKQGFKVIIDNPSLSDSYKQDMKSAVEALEKLEDSKDIQLYIDEIAEIQLEITEKLNSNVTEEKSAVNDLYSQQLYQ